MHRVREDSSVIRCMNFLTMSGALGLTVRMKTSPAEAVLTQILTDFVSSTGSVGRSAAGLVLHSPDEGL